MWITLSLVCMGCMATMLLLLNQLNVMKVKPSITLFYLFASILLVNFVYLKCEGTSLRPPARVVPWILILCAAAASFFGNLCMLKAMNIAPNPGYPVAIEASKMVIVGLASIWLFGSHFSLSKGGLGTLCCAIGVALICLEYYQKS
jgi:drug/metabolite transporter (DMT)-like permease